jgi:hypothetical protein
MSTKKTISIRHTILTLGMVCLIFLLLISDKCIGQANYVLNPSLEQYNQCPDGFDEITYSISWSALDSIYNSDTVVNGRPDYCNTCAVNNIQTGIPVNGAFYHYPHTGNGMAEVQMFFDESYVEGNKRDYLQGRLYKPLTAGTSYCVSFYVTLEQLSTYAINHIGAYLDDGVIDTTTCPGCVQTQYVPQIFETTIINDTLNWYKVEGNFIAKGTERFITIGNFFDTAHTNYELSISHGMNNYSWYLVDDVSVVESDLPAYAGNDTAIGKGDTILIGRNEEALDCKWYVGSSLIDSGAGIKVHPDSTTTYIVQQTVCGLVKYDTVTVTVWPVSVKEVNRLKRLMVYPNPSDGSCTLKGVMNGGAVLQVYNALGQQVYRDAINGSGNFEKKLQLNVPSGAYLLQLTNNSGERMQQRLVITK